MTALYIGVGAALVIFLANKIFIAHITKKDLDKKKNKLNNK